MRKKIFTVLAAILLSVTMAFSFAACGDRSGGGNKETPPTGGNEEPAPGGGKEDENKEDEGKEEKIPSEKSVSSGGVEYEWSGEYGGYMAVDFASGAENSAELSLPEAVGEYPVVGVATSCFENCAALTRVSLGKNVVYLGDYAFSDCENLTDVSVPDGFLVIGESAFENCEKLKFNEYGNCLYLGNAENPYVVLMKAKNTEITEITLPESVKTFAPLMEFLDGQYENLTPREYGNAYYLGSESNPYFAFFRIKDPESATECAMHEQTKIVMPFACGGQCSVTKLTVPDGVEYIGGGAFYGCISLAELSLPESVTFLGGAALAGCMSIKEFTVPSKITRIYGTTFLNCDALEHVTLPDGLKSIGDGAFHSCLALKKIKVPDKTSYIAERAFAYCDELAEVIIPDRCVEIAELAFSGCGKLKFAEYEGGYYLGNESNPYVVLVKAKTVDSEQEEKLTKIVVHARAKVICTGALNNCPDLEGLSVASGNALYRSAGNCIIETATETVVAGCQTSRIPSGVKKIGERAFWGCIPKRANADGEDAPWLKIEIPSGVETIGERAFYSCDGLLHVTLPGSVTVVGYEAFPFPFMFVTLEHSLTEYCKLNVAFLSVYNSSLDVSVKFFEAPNVKIGNDLTIPSGITLIQQKAFQGSPMRTVTLPEGVACISDEAFERCEHLTSVKLPKSVTYFGYRAFAGCPALNKIEYAGTKEEWAKIYKQHSWKENSDNVVVSCSDGVYTEDAAE